MAEKEYGELFSILLFVQIFLWLISGAHSNPLDIPANLWLNRIRDGDTKISKIQIQVPTQDNILKH